MASPRNIRAEDVPRRRIRPMHLVLGSALLASILTAQILIVLTEKAAARETERFQAASLNVTNLANIQRETLRLGQEVTALPQTKDLEKTELVRAFVNQQVRRLGSVRNPGLHEDFSAIQAVLRSYDAWIEEVKTSGRYEIAEVTPILAELEKLVKQTYDREEKRFFDATAASLRAGQRVQRLLFALGLLVVGVGVLLALSVRRSVRSDFEIAYRSLRKEFEERKAAEAALRSSEERFRSLVQNSSDVVTVVDEGGIVLYLSPAADRLFGVEAAFMEGSAIADRVHPQDRDKVSGLLHSWNERSNIDGSFEWRMRHADGAWLHCETRATNLLSDPNVAGIVLNTRDVTERKVLEEQLAHRAFHDPLTELANRALFRDRVEHAIVGTRRGRTSIAILFLDLDDFKRINDTLGHATGDRVLEEVARRLRTCVRPEDTIARFGGDEFAILVEDAADHAAVRIADRILEEMQQPFVIGGKAVGMRVSIGIAEGDPDAETVDSLMRNADLAMYAVKSSGRGTYEVFRPALHAAVLQRIELETGLERASERGELIVNFQPIVDLQTEGIVGIEALARWNHPTRGLISPSEFIPLAEETGAIHSIGRHVLYETTALAARCLEMHADVAPAMINVNVSARQFEDPGFVDEVRGALEASGLEPSRLVLEITEGVLVRDGEANIAELKRLKALGVRIAIDDFGTGYSSLSYLRRLPVDILKIDKSFVDRLGDGVEEVAFVEAVYRLARTLGLATVVEGIETGDQLRLLKSIGLEMGQGFLFAGPMAFEDVSAMLDGAAAASIRVPA